MFLSLSLQELANLYLAEEAVFSLVLIGAFVAPPLVIRAFHLEPYTGEHHHHPPGAKEAKQGGGGSKETQRAVDRHSYWLCLCTDIAPRADFQFCLQRKPEICFLWYFVRTSSNVS